MQLNCWLLFTVHFTIKYLAKILCSVVSLVFRGGTELHAGNAELYDTFLPTLENHSLFFYSIARWLLNYRYTRDLSNLKYLGKLYS